MLLFITNTNVSVHIYDANDLKRKENSCTSGFVSYVIGLRDTLTVSGNRTLRVYRRIWTVNTRETQDELGPPMILWSMLDVFAYDPALIAKPWRRWQIACTFSSSWACKSVSWGSFLTHTLSFSPLLLYLSSSFRLRGLFKALSNDGDFVYFLEPRAWLCFSFRMMFNVFVQIHLITWGIGTTLFPRICCKSHICDIGVRTSSDFIH